MDFIWHKDYNITLKIWLHDYFYQYHLNKYLIAHIVVNVFGSMRDRVKNYEHNSC